MNEITCMYDRDVNWERVLIHLVIFTDKLMKKHMHVERNRKLQNIVHLFLMLFSPRETELKLSYPSYSLLVFPAITVLHLGYISLLYILTQLSILSFLLLNS